MHNQSTLCSCGSPCRRFERF